MTRENFTGVRLSEDDIQMVSMLKEKTGADSTSMILRMGLRALAKQNGIKVPA